MEQQGHISAERFSLDTANYIFLSVGAGSAVGIATVVAQEKFTDIGDDYQQQ